MKFLSVYMNETVFIMVVVIHRTQESATLCADDVFHKRSGTLKILPVYITLYCKNYKPAKICNKSFLFGFNM